jgi:hypothetical protein
MYVLAPTQADMGRLVTEAQEQLKALSKVEQELLQEKARNQQLQKALGEAAAAQKDIGTKYTKLIKQHGSAVDAVTKTHEVGRADMVCLAWCRSAGQQLEVLCNGPCVYVVLYCA